MLADALHLPPPLKPGSKVRLIAPAMAVHRGRFEAGVAHIRTMGLVPVFDDGVFRTHGYLAGDDTQRLDELLAALADDEAEAIWVARGGFGCTRLLPGLEAALERIRERGIWLIGFSDVTALHGAWHRAGLATLHGPNVSTLDRWSDQARQNTWDLLRQPPCGRLPGSLVRGRPGATAPLVGGNLALLCAMVGTGYLPPLQGRFLLIEDVGEEFHRLDRNLTHLRQAGALQGLAGYVIGQLTWMTKQAPEDYARAALEIVLGHVGDGDVPVLTQVPVGHEPSSLPVPLGVNVRMESDGLVLAV